MLSSCDLLVLPYIGTIHCHVHRSTSRDHEKYELLLTTSPSPSLSLVEVRIIRLIYHSASIRMQINIKLYVPNHAIFEQKHHQFVDEELVLLEAASYKPWISSFHWVSFTRLTRRSYVINPFTSPSTSTVWVHTPTLQAYRRTWSCSSDSRRWLR